jgi:uncharacterized protein YndB with AHSA1/START domain
MNDAAIRLDTQSIVVDEVFPHTPASVWKALTTPELIGRWLKMPSQGFAPVRGNRFTYQTTPAGEWDGFIHCEVLEATPGERLVYAWRGGHEGNSGYGSLLDTIVSMTLTPVAGGTRLRLVHSGFVTPKNDTAFKSMSGGWPKVFKTIEAIAAEQSGPSHS